LEGIMQKMYEKFKEVLKNVINSGYELSTGKKKYVNDYGTLIPVFKKMMGVTESRDVSTNFLDG